MSLKNDCSVKEHNYQLLNFFDFPL